VAKLIKQRMEAVQLKQRVLAIHRRLCIFRCLWVVFISSVFLLAPLHWTVPLFFGAALLKAVPLKTIDIIHAPWWAAMYPGSILRLARLSDDYVARVIDTVQGLNMKEYGYGGADAGEMLAQRYDIAGKLIVAEIRS
jgi:hypothetical protein